MPRQLIDIMLSAKAQEAASSKDFIVGVKNAKGDEPAEIAIYGTIGDPYERTDAASMGQFLRENKGRNIDVRINSPGGLAYDGITMHNALLHHDGRVTTVIEGIAGSAASIIAMAGHEVKIFENAQLFIHRASLIVVGNVDDMDAAREWLDKIDDAIVRTYMAKTGKPADKIRAWMKGKVDGTVFSAQEALANKFASEIIPVKRSGAKNSMDVRAEAGRFSTASAGLRRDAEHRLDSIVAERMRRIENRRELFQPAE